MLAAVQQRGEHEHERLRLPLALRWEALVQCQQRCAEDGHRGGIFF
jgi:hypothetical protein